MHEEAMGLPQPQSKLLQHYDPASTSTSTLMEFVVLRGYGGGGNNGN